jgi:hypothetical protein
MAHAHAHAHGFDDVLSDDAASDANEFAVEIPCVPTTREEARSIVGALFWSAVSGLLAGATGAVLLGLDYLTENVGERLPVDELAPVFVGFMVVTGVLASIAVRAAVLGFDRSPVLAATIFGAIVGLGPGSFGATQFGSQPLPFVGAFGLVLASAPLLVVVAFAHARSDRGGVLRPLIATLVVCTVGAILALVAAEIVRGLSLLQFLRAYQFLGLERLGALVGAAIGITLGCGIGCTIKLRRWMRG